MSDAQTIDAYGALIEPATLKIERLLPGPVERVWSYLVDEDMRRRWLAAGKMEMTVGAPFEFVWRNDELTDPVGERPEDMSEEHRLTSRITGLETLRKLSFAWGEESEVTFELEPVGEEVLLTVTHRRVPTPTMLLAVSAGWHAHLDILVARMRDGTPAPFWDSWRALRSEYEKRLSA